MCTEMNHGVLSSVYDLLASMKLALQSYVHVDLYSLFTTATVQDFICPNFSN